MDSAERTRRYCIDNLDVHDWALMLRASSLQNVEGLLSLVTEIQVYENRRRLDPKDPVNNENLFAAKALFREVLLTSGLSGEFEI